MREGNGQRLSHAHFAYLRACAEGLDRAAAARRYLGLEHGHQLRRLHDQAISYLRALARRAGDSRWRLVGVDIKVPAQGAPGGSRPTLAEWVASHGYEDWSEAEQLAMYAEAWPAPNGAVAVARRREKRAARLRRRQLEVLAELEAAAAVEPRETDPLDAWFDSVTSERLQRAGFVMLGEVARAARAGGRWWSGMPGVGATKAGRLAAYVDRLLPAQAARPAVVEAGQPTAAPGQVIEVYRASSRLSPALDGSAGSNRAPQRPTIDARTDLQAIRAWISARAQSPRTAAVYEREAMRWMLWCAIERGRALSCAGPDDCVAYMAFLRRIPDHWIDRGRRNRDEAGWTPFRGQLGLAARRLAVAVLNIMCTWLVDHARYLAANPWAAVQRGLVAGEDQQPPPASRALTPKAYEALVRHAEHEAVRPETYPAGARNLFLLRWLRHTGMRASEVRAAVRADMRRTRAGWIIAVVGKGNKPRDVSVSSQAIAALNAYLAHRGLPAVADCPPDTPLLAAAAGDGGGTASGIHKAFVRFIQRALRASQLPVDDRAQAALATQHWLRHTYATRWAEAGGPQDVLMAELGHSSPATTAAYYIAQMERRQAEVERLSQF